MISWRSAPLLLLPFLAACDGQIGAFCGGISGVGCSDGFYCRFVSGDCGDGGAIGLCVERPEACTLEFDPVCGCDGETYSNACEAASAGINVESAGACDGEGNVCGGLLGLACPTGQYCDFSNGTCGAADQTGVCKNVPEICTEEFAPVCGCDDRTYDNACFAAAAGVSVAATGACDDSQGPG